MSVTISASTAVALGIDRLLETDRRLVAGRRVGVVCNPSSIDSAFRHTADRLVEDADVTVAALFGPQHGFRSDVQDNMIETPHGRDARRSVPVYSLYSETREPTAEMLRDIDVLVVDLQDVGTRVYTYVYTMANCLRAAARHGVHVIVCDRPNPIGGDEVEGNLLEPAYASFVGQFPIPLRHGMTIGELARLFNDGFGIGASLDVVPLGGWRRSMYHDETGVPWIIPSPNLPTLDSAIVYPGAVLFEGTGLSEGRGTTRPFELIGAPWIDGERLADAMNARGLPGVHFRTAFFEPTFHKHAKQTSGGCQVHVLDRRRFRPVRTAVELMSEFRRQDPARFPWREPPYEYEDRKQPIDILYGSDRLRTVLDAGEDVGALVAGWKADEEAFRRTREKYLLY
jgi:uncharacterized protein YbbC (DUF1343 family)